MPPKTLFTAEDVLAAALGLVAERGVRALTARNVARRLRASIAPVYSNFATMGALEEAVMRRAQEIMLAEASRPRTDSAFLDMGVGVAIFARNHGNLFRALFLEGRCAESLHAEAHERLLAGMERDKRLSSLTRDQRASLLDRMAIFTLGLATLICTDQLADTSDEAIIAILREMGAPAIAAAITDSLASDARRPVPVIVQPAGAGAKGATTKRRTGRKRRRR